MSIPSLPNLSNYGGSAASTLNLSMKNIDCVSLDADLISFHDIVVDGEVVNFPEVIQSISLLQEEVDALDTKTTALETRTEEIETKTQNLTAVAGGTTNTGTFTSTGDIIGTLHTSTQQNITQLGTLTSLTVSGDTSLGVTTSTDLVVTGNANITGNTTCYNLTIQNDYEVEGNTTTTGTTTTNVLNVTGNASVGGTLTATGGVTGEILTAAQPNITSTGDLTIPSLAVNNQNSSAALTVASFLAPNNAINVNDTTFYLGNSLNPYASAFFSYRNYTVSSNSALLIGMYGQTQALYVRGSTVGVAKAPAYTLDVNGVINAVTNYKVGGTDVLNSTTLGSTVVASSLTSVGTLSSLSVSGNLAVNADALYVDATSKRVGINTTSGLTVQLTVNGDQQLRNGASVGRSLWIGNGVVDSATQKFRLYQDTTSAYIDVTGNGKLNFRSGTTPVIKAMMDVDNGYLALGKSSAPTVALDVTGAAVVSSSMTSQVLKASNGLGLLPVQGSLLYADTQTYCVPAVYKMLTATKQFTNSVSKQSIFGLVELANSTIYEFEANLPFYQDSRTTQQTTHYIKFGMNLGGTMTGTYWAHAKCSRSTTGGATGVSYNNYEQVTGTAATALTNSMDLMGSQSAFTAGVVYWTPVTVRGVITTGATGSKIEPFFEMSASIQLFYSMAPAGYIRFSPVGPSSSTTATSGTWT